MTPSRWQQIEELYQAARKLRPEERSAYLAGVDPELQREVEALLAQENRPTDATITVTAPLTAGLEIGQTASSRRSCLTVCARIRYRADRSAEKAVEAQAFTASVQLLSSLNPSP
jgi:hypothetical protein